MTRTRFLRAAAATLVLAACSQSPQAAPSPSPQPSPAPAAAPAPSTTPAPTPATAAGTYDFSTRVQGEEVTGTITITGGPGNYRGTIVSTATAEVPIRSVTMEGQTITVTADTPEGEAVLQMVMEGLDFSGTWSFGGQSGTLQGRKRG